MIDVADFSDDIELLIGSTCITLLDLYLTSRHLKSYCFRVFFLLFYPRSVLLDGMKTVGGEFVGFYFVIETAHDKIG